MFGPTTAARGKPRAFARLIFPGLLLFVLAIGGFGAPADGEVEAGPQFQVSDVTTGYAFESDPSVAADANGNFVVVWRGGYEYGPPYGYLIQGRRFAADGTPSGPPFQVSSIATGYAFQSDPSVAAGADGDFVVVWDEYYYPGLPYGRTVEGRRFTTNGTPEGPQFQVGGASYYSEPSVASDADGDFVVVWRDYYYYGPPYGPQIQGRRFASDGTPAGPQFKVGSTMTGYVYESQPSVAADEDGDFVVVWRDYQEYPGPPYGFLVQGRRFAADGTSDGPQFQVGSTSYYSEPSVASNPDGDFVVVWADYQEYPGPPYGYLIQGRQFAVGINVDIDIMPSDPGNNLNLRAGKGASISVAVLSVDGLEVPNLIDPSTLKFGPGKASISGSPRVRDVDGDGDEDLLVKFPTNETGIACGDTRASLSGDTFDSQSISGSDAINTFNCPRNRKRW